MRRNALVFAAASAVVLAPSDVRAQAPASVVAVASAPTLETELAATVELLGQGITFHLKQLGELGALVTNIRNLLGATNEMFALTRGVKRAYDTIRDYSTEDLKRDLWEGAQRAMPELTEIHEELGMVRANFDSIESDAFFSRYDVHDARMRRAITAGARMGIRSNVYRVLFRGEEGYTEPDNGDMQFVYAAFARSGMLAESIRKAAAESAMAERAGNLIDEADEKGRLDLSMGGSALAAQHQTMANTTAIRAVAESELAAKEKARQAGIEQRKAMANEVESEGFFSKIGGPQ